MNHEEDFDSIFQTLYNKLQPSYSIISVEDWREAMLNIGIPEKEVSAITCIFDRLGFKSFIDVEGVTTGEGYQVIFHDPGEYLTWPIDEIDTAVQSLREEMESATDESQIISCQRRIAEITGQWATIQVPYRSEEEMLQIKRVLSAYIKIALEIINRS